MARKIVDISGQKFGSLTAVKCLGVGGSRMLAQWECECECGEKVIAYGADLRNGTRTSCGCGRKKIRKPKADACVVCGNCKITARNMCSRCYRNWWEEKHKIEMERYL